MVNLVALKRAGWLVMWPWLAIYLERVCLLLRSSFFFLWHFSFLSFCFFFFLVSWLLIDIGGCLSPGFHTQNRSGPPLPLRFPTLLLRPDMLLCWLLLADWWCLATSRRLSSLWRISPPSSRFRQMAQPVPIQGGGRCYCAKLSWPSILCMMGPSRLQARATKQPNQSFSGPGRYFICGLRPGQLSPHGFNLDKFGQKIVS